jgi:hypothetical protein
LAALGGVLRDADSSPMPGPLAESVRRTLLELAESAADSDAPEGALALDALDALGALRDEATSPRVARLLSHRDAVRRLRAASAAGNLLAKTGAESLAAALLTTLQDPEPRVVAEAAWALGKLPRRSPAYLRVAAGLRKALQQRAGVGEAADVSGAGLFAPAAVLRAVRTNLLGALTRLGVAESGDAQWLSDEDPGVRANAALVLLALPSRSPGLQARLRNLALVDEDYRVRQNAARAGRADLDPRSPPVAEASARVHYLTTYQMDHDHRPLAESGYRLTLPDGLVRVGFTDRRGVAREELIPPGPCEVELLLDAAP